MHSESASVTRHLKQTMGSGISPLGAGEQIAQLAHGDGVFAKADDAFRKPGEIYKGCPGPLVQFAPQARDLNPRPSTHGDRPIAQADFAALRELWPSNTGSATSKTFGTVQETCHPQWIDAFARRQCIAKSPKRLQGREIARARIQPAPDRKRHSTVSARAVAQHVQGGDIVRSRSSCNHCSNLLGLRIIRVVPEDRLEELPASFGQFHACLGIAALHESCQVPAAVRAIW